MNPSGFNIKMNFIFSSTRIIIYIRDGEVGYDGDEGEVISRIGETEKIDDERYRAMLAAKDRILV